MAERHGRVKAADIEKKVVQAAVVATTEVKTGFDKPLNESPKERDRAAKRMEGRVRAMGIDDRLLELSHKQPDAIRERTPDFVKQFEADLAVQVDFEEKIDAGKGVKADIKRWVASRAERVVGKTRDPLARQIAEGVVRDVTGKKYEDAVADAHKYGDAKEYIDKLKRDGRLVSQNAKDSLEEYRVSEAVVTVMQTELRQKMEGQLVDLTSETVNPKDKKVMLEKMGPEASKIMELQRHSMRKLDQLAGKMPKTESGKKLKADIDLHRDSEKKQQQGVAVELSPKAELEGQERVEDAFNKLAAEAGVDAGYKKDKYYKLMLKSLGVKLPIEDDGAGTFQYKFETQSLLKLHIQAEDTHDKTKAAFAANMEAAKKDQDGVLAAWSTGIKSASAEEAYDLAHNGVMEKLIAIRDQQDREKAFDNSPLGKFKHAIETKVVEASDWIKNIPAVVRSARMSATVSIRRTVQESADARWGKPLAPGELSAAEQATKLVAEDRAAIAEAKTGKKASAVEATVAVSGEVLSEEAEQDTDASELNLKLWSADFDVLQKDFLATRIDAAGAQLKAEELAANLALLSGAAEEALYDRISNWINFVKKKNVLQKPQEPVIQPIEQVPAVEVDEKPEFPEGVFPTWEQYQRGVDQRSAAARVVSEKVDVTDIPVAVEPQLPPQPVVAVKNGNGAHVNSDMAALANQDAKDFAEQMKSQSNERDSKRAAKKAQRKAGKLREQPVTS